MAAGRLLVMPPAMPPAIPAMAARTGLAMPPAVPPAPSLPTGPPPTPAPGSREDLDRRLAAVVRQRGGVA